MTDQQKETAIQYFEAYPKEDVLHISTDGQVFLQKNHHDGVNHQRRINETVPLVTVYRKEIYAVDTAGGEMAGAGNFPTSDNTKDEIVAWLKEKGIEADVKEKKDDLLEKVLTQLANEQDEEESEN